MVKPGAAQSTIVSPRSPLNRSFSRSYLTTIDQKEIRTIVQQPYEAERSQKVHHRPSQVSTAAEPKTGQRPLPSTSVNQPTLTYPTPRGLSSQLSNQQKPRSSEVVLSAQPRSKKNPTNGLFNATEKGLAVPGRISGKGDRPSTQTRAVSARVGPSAVSEASTAGVKGTKFFKHILSSAQVPQQAQGSGNIPECQEDDDLRLLVSQSEMSDWKLPFSLYPLDDQMRQQAIEDNASGKKFYEGPYPDVEAEIDEDYNGKEPQSSSTCTIYFTAQP